MINVCRVYDKKIPDGYKILVDRLWPRGIKKEFIDYWARDIAPSEELRKWFSHDRDKWKEFVEKYKNELTENEKLNEFLIMLREKEKNGNVIFLYATKEENFNNANALKLIIESIL
ncbi:MAG: DUF488 domain-containing protein [Thermoplasmata archaeon]